MLSRVGAGALLLALSACMSAPRGPGSTNLVDGSYQGRATLTLARGPVCPTGQYGVIEIGDRTLDFGYTPDIVLEAAVNPDGRMHVEQGGAVLDGRLTGEHLAFTVSTPTCQSSYAADFIWNHS